MSYESIIKVKEFKARLEAKREKYREDLEWEPRHRSPITLTPEELDSAIFYATVAHQNKVSSYADENE